MLIFNKGKRAIDGIPPLGSKEYSDEAAKKLLKMYPQELSAYAPETSKAYKALLAENKALKKEIASSKKGSGNKKGRPPKEAQWI